MSDEKPNSSQYPLGEPSVLDYVKSLFHARNGERIQIPVDKSAPVEEKEAATQSFIAETPVQQPVNEAEPELSLIEEEETEPRPAPEEAENLPPTPFPWRSLLALLLALFAQSTFEPPRAGAAFGLVLYLGAFSLLGWPLYHGEWTLAPIKPTSNRSDPLTYHGIPLIIGLALAL